MKLGELGQQLPSFTLYKVLNLKAKAKHTGWCSLLNKNNSPQTKVDGYERRKLNKHKQLNHLRSHWINLKLNSLIRMIFFNCDNLLQSPEMEDDLGTGPLVSINTQFCKQTKHIRLIIF